MRTIGHFIGGRGVKGTSGRFADVFEPMTGDVQAQVAWQLGCTGYPVADVAVLSPDSLTIYEQQSDGQLFSDLIAVAADFRRRLADGGPFARSEERIRRDHPADDGSEITADAEVADAVIALLDLRAQIARHEATEKALKAAIEARMGTAAVMTGPGFRVTWKRTRDQEVTDWKAVAGSLLATLSETDRATAVAPHITVRPGRRPLRVTSDRGDTE